MREDFSGWFVEVPKSLKTRFKELYPGRSAQRRVTLAAIEWAIANHPSQQNGKEDVKTKMHSDNSEGDTMRMEASIQQRSVQSAQSGEAGKAAIPAEGLAREA